MFKLNGRAPNKDMPGMWGCAEVLPDPEKCVGVPITCLRTSLKSNPKPSAKKLLKILNTTSCLLINSYLEMCDKYVCRAKKASNETEIADTTMRSELRDFIKSIKSTENDMFARKIAKLLKKF